MLLVCPQCGARLQLDDAKAPARPFSVRCPKCQANVNHSPAGGTESPAAEVSTASDVTSPTRFETPTAAPRFKPREEAEVVPEEANVGMAEIAKLLATALNT